MKLPTDFNFAITTVKKIIKMLKWHVTLLQWMVIEISSIFFHEATSTQWFSTDVDHKISTAHITFSQKITNISREFIFAFGKCRENRKIEIHANKTNYTADSHLRFEDRVDWRRWMRLEFGRVRDEVWRPGSRIGPVDHCVLITFVPIAF